MSDPKESPCPDCGEMVRVNSLRCWNCGAFMDPATEEKFMEMQSKPSAPLLSQLPEDEVSSVEDESDDDFELSMPKSQTAAKSEAEEKPDDANQAKENADAVAPKSSAGGTEASGDDLLDIAMKESKERNKKRKARSQMGGMRTPGGGLIIFCPYGCRIEVKEAHRGMQGKCPKCRAPFIVPIDPPDFSSKSKDVAAAASDADKAAQTGFRIWVDDLHLHAVNPEKLKLKADSLVKEFVLADFGFSDEKLLVSVFGKKGTGLMKAGGNTKEGAREALKQQLQEGKKIEELELGEKYAYSKDDLAKSLKVVQPTASRAESIFHGITVFGDGRIAVQLPAIDDKPELLFVSIGLTQFWEFKAAAEEMFGVAELGAGCGIPDEHVYSTYACHITGTPLKALENVKFYKADETVELETIGYQCGKCNIVVSEAGRAQEKLGGKSPKGIAKAKCPKCTNKMGDNPLFGIKVEEPKEAETAKS